MKEINVIIEGGKASSGPPIGPALGPMGVNAAKVVADVNAKTKSFEGMKVPVKIIVDPKTKDYSIEIGTPPVSELLKKKAGLEKGNGKSWKEGEAKNLEIDTVVEIAKSLSGKSLSKDLKNAVKEVLGSAMSMGITVEGKVPRELTKDIDSGKYDSKFK